MDNTQNEIWRWIDQYKEKWGYPPCRREIEQKFNFGGTLVQQHLKKLEQEGVIRVDPFKARGIAILRRPEAQP